MKFVVESILENVYFKFGCRIVEMVTCITIISGVVRHWSVI
jgi:hypothetical protein